MCRKNQLHGCCLLCLGLGLLLGHCIGSWLFCGLGGFGLVIFGFVVIRKR